MPRSSHCQQSSALTGYLDQSLFTYHEEPLTHGHYRLYRIKPQIKLKTLNKATTRVRNFLKVREGHPEMSSQIVSLNMETAFSQSRRVFDVDAPDSLCHLITDISTSKEL